MHVTGSKQSWKIIRRLGWFRYVVLRHALAQGLFMGIGIPLLNSILPSPNYDISRKLAFSVPFFVIAWGTYGAYSWHKEQKKHRQRDETQ
jgi:hypothetical protein